MANKPGVMIYFETGRAIKWLDYESKGRLFEAIMEYAKEGKVPEFEGALAMAWSFVVDKIDRDSVKYAETVVKRKRAAYAKWWEEYAKENGIAPNNKLEKERWIDMQMQANDASASDAMQTVQEMPTVSVTPSVSVTISETETGAGAGKGMGAVNHGQPQSTPTPYGTYKNVFLTPEEYATLAAEIPNLNMAINKLSIHMKSSGKTYTSHEATIRKWAMEDEEKNRSSTWASGDWCSQTNRTPYSAEGQYIPPELLED